jgi:hypothetical protein
VPPGTFVGQDALDKFAGDLRATHPHFVYTHRGVPQVLHNSGRLAWGSGPKGEAPEYTGTDFIIVRNGKIAALYVYLDAAPTWPAHSQRLARHTRTHRSDPVSADCPANRTCRSTSSSEKSTIILYDRKVTGMVC